MTSVDPFLPKTRTAYFSMEMALAPHMHTYSGGLGVLAGDTARSCADLELPVVFVTLISRMGYLRQEISASGEQIDHPDPWEPRDWAEPLDAMVAVRIRQRPVWIRPWLHVVVSPNGGKVPVLLLDTDLEQNSPSDRRVTDVLYGGDAEYRLMQEIVLGIGGERVLHALEFEIETFHLNEGHAALLSATLLRRYPVAGAPSGVLQYDAARVREQCVFTTHTPVEAAHDKHDYGLVRQLLDDFISVDQLKIVAGDDALNMTCLALRLSGYINGVAERHAALTQRQYPEFHIREITNGVHAASWVHPVLAPLFHEVAPGWQHDPIELANADRISSEKLWRAHQAAKEDLTREVKRLTGKTLSLDVPIIAFARRMTGYKRPDLIFADMSRVRSIAQRRPFQIVIAGKAHPADFGGKQKIREIHDAIETLSDLIPCAFLPDYDLQLARIMVAGADVWLNTPLPPLEASGTSGMKAAMNGVLNLSVLDGWWLEGWVEGETGWAVGEDGAPPDTHARLLYEKLEQVVLPMYADRADEWLRMMKHSISKIGSRFNSQRMMRRYASEAYLR